MLPKNGSLAIGTSPDTTAPRSSSGVVVTASDGREVAEDLR